MTDKDLSLNMECQTDLIGNYHAGSNIGEELIQNQQNKKQPLSADFLQAFEKSNGEKQFHDSQKTQTKTESRAR